MKNILSKARVLVITAGCMFFGNKIIAQTPVYQWQLANVIYSSTDPDAGGPANGSVQFTLQMRLASGVGVGLTGISTGYSYQSAKAMIPTTPGCATVNQPANIVLSSTFTTAGFVYNSVNQCNNVAQSTGGQSFDKTAAGTLENGTINLGSSFVDVFTVTLWTLGAGAPEGGYGVINSGNGGTPGPLGSYAASDIDANEYVVNSQTYATPLALGSGAAPVTLVSFKAECVKNGSLIKWSTASEQNNSRFVIERSPNGSTFTSVGTIAGNGNSNVVRNYEFLDLNSGRFYYRLKQIDFDGTFKYSETVRLDCENKQSISVLLYPVPARDRINIAVKSDKSLNTVLQIFDAAGRIVRIQRVTVANGTNNYYFDLNGLAAGDYLIRSADNELNLNRKFSIIR